ncbi:MAG: Uma2 family endonuclease [Solirubrobacteraceae bacterium]
MQVAERMMANEFLLIEDPRHLQLIEGEVVVTEAEWLHQRVSGDLYFALRLWTDAEPDRGEVALPIDVKLDERNVYAPDLSWYAEGHVPPGHAPKRPYEVPDLAIEIRSPSTWRYDVGTKKRVYEERGLRELWLVDTDAQSVLVFRRSTLDQPAFDVALELDRSGELTSPLLAGFTLPPVSLFPEE